MEVLLAYLLQHSDSIFMLSARVSNYGQNFHIKDQISIWFYCKQLVKDMYHCYECQLITHACIHT